MVIRRTTKTLPTINGTKCRKKTKRRIKIALPALIISDIVFSLSSGGGRRTWRGMGSMTTFLPGPSEIEQEIAAPTDRRTDGRTSERARPFAYHRGIASERASDSFSERRERGRETRLSVHIFVVVSSLVGFGDIRGNSRRCRPHSQPCSLARPGRGSEDMNRPFRINNRTMS